MMTHPENFADYPESIADRRSDLSQSGKDWAPRDVLIKMLRDIDSGKMTVDTLCVCYRKTHGPDEPPTTSFAASSKDGHVTVGVVHIVLDYLTKMGSGMLVLGALLAPVWQFLAEIPV